MDDMAKEDMNFRAVSFFSAKKFPRYLPPAKQVGMANASNYLLLREGQPMDDLPPWKRWPDPSADLASLPDRFILAVAMRKKIYLMGPVLDQLQSMGYVCQSLSEGLVSINIHSCSR